MKKKNSQERRRMWTTPYLLRRPERSIHSVNIWSELRLEDPWRFRRCLRMDEPTFCWLLEAVTPRIEKKNTTMRQSIPPAERLSMTLRFLATGESQESLRLQFRVGQSTVSGILKETIDAINAVLDGQIRVPATEEKWHEKARRFDEMWNFPHAIGAIDGKHVAIEAPIGSGSMFYNYKGFSSIVLFAAVDADLRFTFVDIGTNGRDSDAGIWQRSLLKKAIDDGSLKIPPSQIYKGSMLPFVFLSDEGLPLGSAILIPFSKALCRNRQDRRIFNYRLSRARRVVENAFGLLVARFLLLRSPIRIDPDVASKAVLACCNIHNLLRSQTIDSSTYIDHSGEDGAIIPGEWRTEEQGTFHDVCRQSYTRPPLVASKIRDKFCDLFNSVYKLPWQDRHVNAD
ncbi:Hypothetical protein NTJ_04273 [Nesidiocoris tenuis]|nr:Hypothetical protein NTJ_04273 [Nesidiocoris tenuis]